MHVSADFAPYGAERDRRVAGALGAIPLVADGLSLRRQPAPAQDGRGKLVQGVHALLPRLAATRLARSGAERPPPDRLVGGAE